jgi:hypothetical protein
MLQASAYITLLPLVIWWTIFLLSKELDCNEFDLPAKHHPAQHQLSPYHTTIPQNHH